MYVIILFFTFPVLVLGKPMPMVCWENPGSDGPIDICYKGAWLNTNSSSNYTYASFQGIQYAQSPVRDLRFKVNLRLTLICSLIK